MRRATSIPPQAPSEDWADVELLAVIDPGKTVSKTHAALELTASKQILVHDLNSTNGVSVIVPGATEATVEPGSAVIIEAGSDLLLGEYSIRISRS